MLWIIAGCLATACLQEATGASRWTNNHRRSASSYGATDVQPPWLLQGASSPNAPVTSPKKVHVDVYYETNCPDSMDFVTGQLYPLHKDMKDVLDVHLIPYGKATETLDSTSGKFIFRCHHGAPECHGNTVQTCAISMYPSVDDHLPFIDCMESYPRPSSSGRKCARRHSLDWKRLSKCAEGDEGNRLLHEMAQRTNRIVPTLTFVPWIVLDNVYSASTQRRSLRNLRSVICEKVPHAKC